jgi:hypothetical protein
VVLTQNEVNLHRLEHPNNALAVVRNIVLDHNGDRPIATGGDLVLVMPWKIDEAVLSAIAYDYRTDICLPLQRCATALPVLVGNHALRVAGEGVESAFRRHRTAE